MNALALLLLLQAAPIRVELHAGKERGSYDSWKRVLSGRAVETVPLDKAEVLILFTTEGLDRGGLDKFLGRGGALVVLNDAIRSSDPAWWKGVVGGAWDPAESKSHRGRVGLYFGGGDAPIASGCANFFFDDEILWDLQVQPEIRVLARGFRTSFEITPQMWTYERDGRRAFVSLPGRRAASLDLPHFRALLLRGLAWAARREVDSLLKGEEKTSLRYPEGGPIRPDRASASIKTLPDFELTLVAAEPDVVKPIALEWDASGRLWVAMTPGYPDKAQTRRRAPEDSIAVLEDRDGDGRWDRRKTFADRLDLVTGLLPWRDGVLVAQAPEILFLRDTDGDGAADRREVLFTGFGWFDTHAVLSNLRWGLDGWVYADQGYCGSASKDVRDAKGRSFGKIGQGIFRFKPDGSAIEPYCSLSESNTWGIDFSWDGELYASMATNGWHLRHVIAPEKALDRVRLGKAEASRNIPDHRNAFPLLKYTEHPYIQIDNVGGFSAAAGSAVYTGGAWPAEFDGTHFLCEPTINIVHQDVIRPDGASFRASHGERATEFVAGTDLWFRPVDLHVGPDGALYIADFYTQAVIHNDIRGPQHGPHAAAIRPDRDHEHGRIWRLQHRSAPSFGPVALERAGIDELVRTLSHPNRWRRLTAQRLLTERGAKAAVPALRALLEGSSAPAKVHALWTLHHLGEGSAADLAKGLQDPSAGVRKNAAQIAALRPSPELLRALVTAVNDRDSRARLHVLLALAAHPADREISEAVVRAWPALGDDVSRSVAAGVAAGFPLGTLEAALRCDGEDLAEQAARRAGAGDVLAVVARHPKSCAAQAAALRGVKREDPAPSGPARAALEELLRATDIRVLAAVFPLASRWMGSDPSVPRVGEVLLQAAEREPRALGALLEASSFRPKALVVAERILGLSPPDGVLEALARTADPEVAPLLLRSLPRLAGASRDRAIDVLLRRSEWSGHVVAELEAGRLRLADLGPTALFRLRNHPDSPLAARAAKAIDVLRGSESRSKDEILARLLPTVRQSGDPARGKALLAENCLKCHGYKGEGKTFAPDLTGIGIHGKDELLVHIVDPNRVVEGNFVSYNLRTRGGEVHNGILVRESPAALSLRNAESEIEVRRSEIESIRSTGLSLMPEGLEALGAEALRDLLTYLCAEEARFRVIDLQKACTASTLAGLYDPGREEPHLFFKRHGRVAVEGIPFDVLDPAKTPKGMNAVVLKGGADPAMGSKVRMPQRVEVAVGHACAKIHVLGGIGAWGTQQPKKGLPALKVTYRYAGGASEEKILYDGLEFADWIRRADVPGSKYAEGLLREDSWGQVRWFTLEPGRQEAIERITLESFDNRIAPTVFAMTSE